MFYVDARDGARRPAPLNAGSVPCLSAGLLRPGRRSVPRDDSNDCTESSQNRDELQSVEFDAPKHTLIYRVIAGLLCEIIRPRFETISIKILDALHGILVSAEALTMIDRRQRQHDERLVGLARDLQRSSAPCDGLALPHVRELQRRHLYRRCRCACRVDQ
ncbi:hypothetical protein PCAR4_100025 [Paraburkholderia caribensis]|nr:hypothetical protein PCAR4_100025 [Paraburkholderia caribensis]